MHGRADSPADGCTTNHIQGPAHADVHGTGRPPWRASTRPGGPAGSDRGWPPSQRHCRGMARDVAESGRGWPVEGDSGHRAGIATADPDGPGPDQPGEEIAANAGYGQIHSETKPPDVIGRAPQVGE